jgi:cytochrome c-type biogenesis protein CcmH
MSPACPGRTLINCTSAQSEQWRELIRQKLAQGQSSAEIIQYFVDISGEEILAAPPKRGFALTAWLLPAFVLLNGAGLIMVLTLRWARRTPARSSAAYDLAAQGEAAPSEPYLRRVQQDLERLQR